MTKKSEAAREFEKATGKTEFVIVKLKSIPNDCPVLAVTEYRTKSMASFFMVDNVLVPKSAVKTIKADKKPIKKKTPHSTKLKSI